MNSLLVVLKFLAYLPGFLVTLLESIPAAWQEQSRKESPDARDLVFEIYRFFTEMDGLNNKGDDAIEIRRLINEIGNRNPGSDPFKDVGNLMKWLLPILGGGLNHAQREKQLETTGRIDENQIVKFFVGSTMYFSDQKTEEFINQEISLEHLDTRFKDLFSALVETSYGYYGKTRNDASHYYAYNKDDLPEINFYDLKKSSEWNEYSKFEVPQSFFLDPFMSNNNHCWSIREDLVHFGSQGWIDRKHFFRKVRDVTEYQLSCVIIREKIDEDNYYIYINNDEEGWHKYCKKFSVAVTWEDMQNIIDKSAAIMAYTPSKKIKVENN